MYDKIIKQLSINKKILHKRESLFRNIILCLVCFKYPNTTVITIHPLPPPLKVRNTSNAEVHNCSSTKL